MINYQFDKDKKILHVHFTGVVTFDELFDHVSINEEKRSLPDDLKILSDATKAKLSIKPSELKLIKNQLAKTLEKVEYLYDAFVVSKPKETAITTLYMELAKLKNYKFKVFSSIEAAEYWLAQK